MNRLSALVLVILGLLLAVSGYRGGQAWNISLGVVFLIVGLALLHRLILGRK